MWNTYVLTVKKAAALQIKAGSLSTPIAKTSQKRKNQGDRDRSLKKVVNQPINLGPSLSQATPNPPQHGVGKGLMMAHDPIINGPVTPFTLLVKDKQHAV